MFYTYVQDKLLNLLWFYLYKLQIFSQTYLHLSFVLKRCFSSRLLIFTSYLPIQVSPTNLNLLLIYFIS